MGKQKYVKLHLTYTWKVRKSYVHGQDMIYWEIIQEIPTNVLWERRIVENGIGSRICWYKSAAALML